MVVCTHWFEWYGCSYCSGKLEIESFKWSSRPSISFLPADPAVSEKNSKLPTSPSLTLRLLLYWMISMIRKKKELIAEMLLVEVEDGHYKNNVASV